MCLLLFAIFILLLIRFRVQLSSSSSSSSSSSTEKASDAIAMKTSELKHITIMSLIVVLLFMTIWKKTTTYFSECCRNVESVTLCRVSKGCAVSINSRRHYCHVWFVSCNDCSTLRVAHSDESPQSLSVGTYASAGLSTTSSVDGGNVVNNQYVAVPSSAASDNYSSMLMTQANSYSGSSSVLVFERK